MAPESDVFIDSAEAAFIADISDRDVNRAIDEHLLPDALVHSGSHRCVARSAAPLMSFYFETAPWFSTQLRKRILFTIADRLKDSETATNLWAPNFHSLLEAKIFEFASDEPKLQVDLSAFFERAGERWRLVDSALSLISSNEQVLGGTPVFKDTRVPIDVVLASIDAGVTLARLRQSYEFLTPSLIDAARTYARIRPRRGRPRRLSEINPELEIVSSEVVRAPSGPK